MSLDKEIVAARLRTAEKMGLAVGRFWLRQTRFLQQVGDGEPQLIRAAPEAPVMIVLPVGTVMVKNPKTGEMVERQLVVPDAFLVPVKDREEAPEAPVPSHLPPGRAPRTKRATERFGKKASKGGKKSPDGEPPASEPGSEGSAPGA